METVVAFVRKWGNSKGIVLPSELGLETGEQIIINIQRTKAMLKAGDLFGKIKTGGNTAKELKKLDKELDVKW